MAKLESQFQHFTERIEDNLEYLRQGKQSTDRLSYQSGVE